MDIGRTIKAVSVRHEPLSGEKVAHDESDEVEFTTAGNHIGSLLSVSSRVNRRFARQHRRLVASDRK